MPHRTLNIRFGGSGEGLKKPRVNTLLEVRELLTLETPGKCCSLGTAAPHLCPSLCPQDPARRLRCQILNRHVSKECMGRAHSRDERARGGKGNDTRQDRELGSAFSEVPTRTRLHAKPFLTETGSQLFKGSLFADEGERSSK